MNASVDGAAIRALLLDIEGTTTSVDFVYQTLFPYARDRVAKFVEQHYDDQDFRSDIERLRQELAGDTSERDCPAWGNQSRENEIASIVQYVNWLMDRDRKSTALKSIQGKIWEAGYQSGELRSHVYPDVRPAFERWRREGKEICIFSSGSTLAQKLLFAHTCEGDLSSFIQAYFDTTTGPKADPESYQRIASSLRLPRRTILFISDSVAELKAASAAGMKSLLCQRCEKSGTDLHGHTAICGFTEI